MTRQPNTTKILLIIGGILLAFGVVAAVNFVIIGSLAAQPAKQPREVSLAAVMPEAPKSTKLVSEGYDPKANCFDKCGYLYRRYSYSDLQPMCRNLFAALSSDARFTITSPATKQPSAEWCETYMKKSFSESAYFTLEVNAAVTLKNGRRDDSRRVASAVILPAQKTIEYRVSQENEGVKLAR